MQVHRKPLEPVRDLAGDRIAVETADLLEVRELCHFHAVQPDFPAESPRAERRILPVVLDEANVVAGEVEAERGERAEIEIENCRRRRLQHHLVLVIVLQPVRVLAVAAVFRAPRRLHVRRAPRLRAQRAQEGRGVRRAGAYLHVVRLQLCATLAAPVVLEGQDDLLKGLHRRSKGCRRREERGESLRFYR